jgi:hypothetical protein
MNLINFNKIDDDCDNKVIENHSNVLIGNKIGSISLMLYSNFTHLNKVHSLYQSEGVQNIYIYALVFNMLLYQTWTIILWNLEIFSDEDVVCDEVYIKI